VIVGVRSNGGHLAAPPGLRRPAAGRRPAEGRCLDSVYKVLSAPRGAIRPSGGGRTPPLAWTRRGPAAQPESPETAMVKKWRYLGRGWANPGDTWLAETAAEELIETRRLAREARRPDPRQPDWGE